MKKILLGLSLVVILGACMDLEPLKPTPQNVNASIIEGQTQRAQVIKFFGEPTSVSKNADGKDVWTYNKITNTSTGETRTFMLIFNGMVVEKYIVY